MVWVNMARLPTADDLPQTTAQTAMKTGSYTARPMTGIASGLDKAGAELMAKAEQDRKIAESYEADKAKVDYLKRESELRMKYETDPDYKTAPDRMKSELDQFRTERMSRLPANVAKDFDLWGQQQVVQAYERQDGDRKLKYKAEELGTWKESSQYLLARAAEQGAAGDEDGKLETLRLFNEQNAKISALSVEARGQVAAWNAGGAAADVGKMMADKMPANKVAGWLKKRDPSIPPQPSPAVSQESATSFIMDRLENEPNKHPDPAGRGFSKFGINSEAHPEVNLDTLTKEQAAQIYKRDYWDKMNIDSLPNEMKMIVYDAAINQGVGFTSEALARSGNNPEMFMQLRKQRYLSIGGSNVKGWLSRLKQVGEASGVGSSEPSTGFYEIDRWRDSDPIGFKNFVEAKASETNQEAVVTKSNFELAIASTKDPVELQTIRQQVDENGLLDTVKKNELKMKIISQGKEMQDKMESIGRGSMFLDGSAYLNPKDTDAVKDANNAYEALTPALQEKPPAERNYIISDMISKTRFVPDLVKGNIISAGRSQKPDEVIAAADFLDRMSVTNPHMMDDLGSEKDLARIRMINDRVNAGVPAKDAMEMVDKALMPMNEAAVQAVKEEIKTLVKEKPATFWREKALEQFESFWSRDPVTTGAGVVDSLDGMAAKFRNAYEDNYLLTRDAKLAEQRAGEVIKGQYGRTSVNGFSQVLQYPPENYFGIEGQDNDWMRDQMVEAAEEVYKGSLNPPSRDYLEKNLRLVVDPKRTARTAAKGAPEYLLAIVRDNALVYFNQEKPFTFSVDAEKKKMVDKARAKADKLKQAEKAIRKFGD